MFTFFNKNNKFINSSLRNYIRTSINQSMQKYIKTDNNIKENNIIVLNEIDKTRRVNTVEGDKDIKIYDKTFNKNQIFGFILFLSIPTFIHYLYSKNY
jgi:hypothetical protein